MFRFLVGLALLGLALAESPILNRMDSNLEMFNTNLDEPNYRLTDSVQPTSYTVEIDVGSFPQESNFFGITTVNVDVTQTGLFQIVMHQKVVRITAISVTDSEGVVVLLRQPNWVEYDNYFELMKINFENELPVGSYSIRIVYEGVVNENQFDRGFYRGYYLVDGVRRYYATTQFQPYHARKAFPCFDEPQFKSRFTIAITRPTSFSRSYSNMAIDDTQTQVLDNGRTREVFLPTPIISAYLIAFHVSDFVETNPSSTAARPVGIVSRPGVTNQHTYAGQMAASLTTWMSTYFDNDYYQHGQGVAMKNDHIALPDFPSGAMENWGMVNYREAYLLYDASNTNLINRIFIATIVSHELAHKWFGNLVTCFWWSNLWLNESFASYYEYFAPHAVEPTLELDEQFVVDQVHSALLADSSVGAWAMNHPSVASNSQISSHFSTTSYAKGASVLRMIKHFVGPNTFQKGQQFYLDINAFRVGTPEAMYEAFTQAVAEDNSLAQYQNVQIEPVFKSWVDQAGYPVLHVNVDHGTGAIQLRQHRYLINGQEGTGLWPIPLTYTRANDINFDDTKPIAVMTTATAALEKPEGHEWVIFNVQQSGYYRVMYDDHSWEMIAEGLKNNRETIHKLNRAQICNDVLNFVRSGSITTELAFEVLDFLEDETDYYVWNGALSSFQWIGRRLSHIEDLSAQFVEYVLGQMETVIEHLGYNEATSDSTSRILNRMQIMNYACDLGHEGCVADSQAKWDAWKANPSQLVPVNLRRYVYCTGIRYGDTSDFDFLWQQYSQSENTADMVVMLRALGCTRSATDLNRYLVLSTNSDLIRYHDRTNAWNYALQGNKENLHTVLAFLYNNYALIREGYGGDARLSVAINALATYLNDYDDVLDFQDWLYTNQLNLPNEFNSGVNVIASATANIRWGNNISIDFRNFFRSRSGASSIVASVGVIFSVLLFQILK